MLYQRSYSHRNKTVVLQPRKLQEVYVVPEVILPETKPWYYSQENYRKSMLYYSQENYRKSMLYSYSHRNKTVVLQPRKLQEVYVVPEVILHAETKPWYYSQENYRKSMLQQRSYSYRNKTVVLQPSTLQEVYVVPQVILPQKQNRGIIAKKTTGSLCCTRAHTHTETKRGIIAKKTTGNLCYTRGHTSTETKTWYYSQENYRNLCCSRGHTPTETKPWYYSQERYRKSKLYQRSSYRNKTVVLQHTGSPTETKPWQYSQERYRKSKLYQRSYFHRNKTVVLQPRKLQEVCVVAEVILPQKQNRGIIAKKTTGSLLQRSYSHRNKTVVIAKKTTGSLSCSRGHTSRKTKPWQYSQENYRKSMFYQRSYSYRNKTVVLQPRKLQEVYVVPEVILLQKQNRGIIAKKTTGSLCCTRGHTPTETKPWYYSQENYRKSMLYKRSYPYRNKTVVLQPRKLQEIYVVPEVILPQKQNRGIIARKTTGSLRCTRGHTPTETKPWYYSKHRYRKSKLYQRSYFHRNKTVVLQPRKLQEVYVLPEVILLQKQNRGVIAKKTTGSLSCTRGHTPTETKPWYYSQENYRKSMLYQRSYSYRNKTVVLQPRKLQEVYVILHTETKPWYYSQENYRKVVPSYSHRNKTVVLQPRKLQEV